MGYSRLALCKVSTWRLAYENDNLRTDIIAWAKQQAQLLRSGHFDVLDIEHIAEEIEDVGKSEQRELENRMAVLLCHLLKWKYQPERRGSSWEKNIHDQRRMLSMRFKKTPSLKPSVQKEEWRLTVWFDAKIAAEKAKTAAKIATYWF